MPKKALEVGKVDDFPKDEYTLTEGEKVFIYRKDEGFLSLSAVCTHQRCVVALQDDGLFHCPCHGSKFDTEGKVVDGPAEQDLPWFEVEITDDDRVIVHLTDIVE